MSGESSYSNSSKSRPSKLDKGGKGTYCCLPNCHSAFYDNNNNKTGITLFKFPADDHKKKTWKRIVNLYRRKGAKDDFTITNYTRICEFHFKSDDINVSLGIGRKTLKKGAIPCKN